MHHHMGGDARQPVVIGRVILERLAERRIGEQRRQRRRHPAGV